MWSFFLTAAADASSEKGGFPAFELWHWPSQIFWLGVSFLVLYLFLSRAILPKISNTLETRADRIQSDLDEAERLALKVAKLDDSLGRTLSSARTSAKTREAEIRKELEAELALAASEQEKVFSEKLAESDVVIANIKSASGKIITDVAADVAQAMLVNFGQKNNKSQIKAAIKAVQGRV